MIPVVSGGDIDITPLEVHKSGAQQHQLSQPRIVVAFSGDVAIRTVAGFFRAHGVGHERTERLPAEAFGRYSLLLVVSPTAICVLSANQRCARGPHGSNPAHLLHPI